MVTSLPRLDEVWLVSLDPTIGSEIRKARPCLVISPDEANQWLRTVIVAPLTSTVRPYPTRVNVAFQGTPGQIALDQIRTVDRRRLTRRLGAVSARTARHVSAVLIEMFRRPTATSSS